MESPETEKPESENSETEIPEIGAVETESSAAEVSETGASEPEAPDAEAQETEVSELEASELGASETETLKADVSEDISKPTEVKTGPNIFQRILLWAAIVVSAIFLLLGLAGIVGVWVANTPATNTVLAILEPIDNSLQRLEVAAGEAGAALDEVSMSLDDADQRIQELGAGLAETNLVAEALSRILDVDVGPRVGTARENIRSIYDTVVAVEETINAINAMPLVRVEVPGSTEMANIRTGMEDMADSAAELREETQQRREERAENLVDAIATPLNRLSDRVEEMRSRISNTEERLGSAIERIDDIQDKVPLWIDIVSIVNTLLFAWLMFSQWMVIVFCWRALHPEPT